MSRKKQIRQNFRNAVFERDGNKCVFCDETDDLDAHHITDRSEMPNGGYVVENGITLCKEHHEDAEWYHKTDGEFCVVGMFPKDLYSKINSSKELATEASVKLSKTTK